MHYNKLFYRDEKLTFIFFELKYNYSYTEILIRVNKIE